MPRDEQHLRDVLESARLALRYSEGKTRAHFLADLQLQDAVVRRLELIGEAVGRMSDEARRRFDTLPWRDMIAMRNLLIHEYDGIDMDIVWETPQRDIPDLVQKLEQQLAD